MVLHRIKGCFVFIVILLFLSFPSSADDFPPFIVQLETAAGVCFPHMGGMNDEADYINGILAAEGMEERLSYVGPTLDASLDLAFIFNFGDAQYWGAVLDFDYLLVSRYEYLSYPNGVQGLYYGLTVKTYYYGLGVRKYFILGSYENCAALYVSYSIGPAFNEGNDTWEAKDKYGFPLDSNDLSFDAVYSIGSKVEIGIEHWEKGTGSLAFRLGYRVMRDINMTAGTDFSGYYMDINILFSDGGGGR